MESDGKLVFGYTAVWSFHCYGIDTVICIVFKEPGERHGVYSTCLCSQSWRHISHPADSGGGFLRGARYPHLEGNYCNVVCWHSNLRPKNHDLQYPTFASHAYDISVKRLYWSGYTFLIKVDGIYSKCASSLTLNVTQWRGSWQLVRLQRSSHGYRSLHIL